MTRSRQKARDLLAAEFDRKGGGYVRTADTIRAGFENFWVEPALDALERLVLAVGYGEDDDPEDDRP